MWATARRLDGGSGSGPDRRRCAFETGEQHRLSELEAGAEIGLGLAVLAIGVDHEARQISRQKDQLVETRRPRNGPVRPGGEALAGDAHQVDRRRVGPGHGEDRLAGLDRVVDRTGLGIAAIAAGGLLLGGEVVVVRLRVGEGCLADTEEGRLDMGELLPGRVLRHRHGAGAIGRAIGHRPGLAAQRGQHVIGRLVALEHRLDDGRRAEGGVSGSEDAVHPGAHVGGASGDLVAVHQAVLGQLEADRLLADCGDDETAGDVEIGAGDGREGPAAVGAGGAERGLHRLHDQTARGLDHRGRGDVVDDLDAFGDRRFELVLAGRDLVGAAAIDHRHLLDAGQATDGAAGVHGDVAAADHHDMRRQDRPFAAVDAVEEAHAVHDAGEIVAGHAEVLAGRGADRQQHGVVALGEVGEADAVAAERGFEMQRDAGAALQDAGDVLFDHRGGQAEVGDAPERHAAGLRLGLVEVDGVTGERDVLRRRQAGGAGADDRHALRLGDGHRRQFETRAEGIEHPALQRADGDRAVGGGAAAGGFAGRVADAAADRRERIGGGDRLEGGVLVALPDQADVGGDVGADRAGDLTGRRLVVRQIGLIGGEIEREGFAAGHDHATSVRSCSTWGTQVGS